MKAAISYFTDEQEHAFTDSNGNVRKQKTEKILCVYSKVHNAWMLPGSDTRDGVRETQGESPEEAQARILLNETNLETVDRKRIYEGPAGYIFAVTVRGSSRNTAFLTREEFLHASPFRPFYEKKFFAHLDQEMVTNSRVTSKSQTGKPLWSIQLEGYRKNDQDELGWWLEKPEHVHAVDSAEVAKIVQGWGKAFRPYPWRLHSFGLSVGFKIAEDHGSKGKVLLA